MTARLKINNVGGLDKEMELRFERGKVNLLTSPSGKGKSSVIKGLIGVITGDIEDPESDSYKEAIALGIRSGKETGMEGFVNLASKEARAKLLDDEGEKEIIMKSSGEYKTNTSNPKFSIAGVITRNSRISRELQEGKNNFEWIVGGELSDAEHYKKWSNEISRYINEGERLLELALERKANTRTLIKEKERLGKDLQKIEKILGELIKGKEEKKEELVKKQIERQKIYKLFIKAEKEYQNFKEKFDVLDREVGDYERKKKKLENNIKSQEDKHTNLIKQAKGIDQNERIKLTKEVSEFKPIRSQYEGQLTLLKSATEIETKVCPVCDSSKFDKKKIKTRLKEIEKKVDEISNKIMSNNRRIVELAGKHSRIEREKAEIENNLRKLRHDLKNIETSDISSKVTELNSTKTKLEATFQEKTKKNEKLKKLDEETLNLSGGDKKIKKGQNDINSIRDKISKIEGELTRPFSQNFRGTDIRLEGSLDEVISKLSGSGDEYKPRKKIIDIKKSKTEMIVHINDTLENDITSDENIGQWKSDLLYCKYEADSYERKARDVFNKNITSVLNNLGYKDIKSVELHMDNRVYVRRIVKNKERLQPLTTLAMSERVLIGSILQLALKETYIPEIPYLILDDILVDLDPSRQEKFLKYLKNRANQEKWYIIVTKPTDSKNIKVSQI